MSEGPVRSPFWFPFPLATAEVEADRLGRVLELTAAGGLEVVIWEVEAGGERFLEEEEDFEMVLVDLDDLAVLDRVTGAEAGVGEGLVASFEEEGLEERDPEGVMSLAEVFLLSFDDWLWELLTTVWFPLMVDLLLSFLLTPGLEVTPPTGSTTH